MRAGDRAAIALASVDLAHVARGAVLVQGSAWRSSRVLRADVALLADAPRALGPRSRVRLHLGTSEASARLVVAGGLLAPGDGASARVVLDTPIVARAGDRFVLRSASPVSTMGGGIVLDPLAPLRARAWPAEARSPEVLLARVVAESGATGVSVGELPVRLGVSPARIDALVAMLAAWRVGDRLIGDAVRSALATDALAVLATYHAEQPLEPGAPLQWLRSRLRAPEVVSAALLATLESAGEIVVTHGLARLASFSPSLTSAQAALRDRVMTLLVARGQEPPAVEELAAELGVDTVTVSPILRLLAREARIVAVEPARYYAAEVVADLVQRLRAGMSAHADYGPAELREMLGFSRKFLIPFLEFSDRAGHTLRDVTGRRRVSGT